MNTHSVTFLLITTCHDVIFTNKILSFLLFVTSLDKLVGYFYNNFFKKIEIWNKNEKFPYSLCYHFCAGTHILTYTHV